MTQSRIDALTLIAVTIVAVLALAIMPAQLAWLGSITGVILLLTIFAYDREGYRSVFQSLAFSTVCGFCFVVAITAVVRIEPLAGLFRLNGPLPAEWLPIPWVCATLIFWAIDRARMKNRQAAGGEYVREPVRRSGSMFNISPDTSANRPAESALRTMPPPSAPEPVPAPLPVTPAPPTPDILSPAPPGAIPPQGAIPIRPLKEAMVYVNLIGEGLNVMRSVRAEHLGRNFYKIVEAMPAEETWEYGPGQVVRCEKKKLSTGKALVAVEEAPRKT